MKPKPKSKSPRKKRSGTVRKSRSRKNIDSGDFSDTGLYNITNNTILELSKDKLLLKYDELIKYLNIRKKQLEITGKSTVRVDMQLKAAKLEMKYLVNNFSTYSVGLRILNNMP